MDYNQTNTFYGSTGSVQEYEPIGRYTAKTFGWMFLGLMVTFITAVGGVYSGLVFQLFGRVPYAIFILGIAELAVVFFLSARISKMSVGSARALFLFYSLLNGVVFSVYFLIYDVFTLVLVFAATSLFFGVMAVAGYVTNADLSRLRNFLVGAVLFLAAFWILSIFINLSQFETIICTIGIFIFLVFTAYDTQKIRAYHQAYGCDPVMAEKASIFAALNLYLDFINLFIYLLRIVGRKK